MGRVALRKIVLSNFRSFKGLHVVDLPVEGLVIIKGQNKDTRGDSGAGKTNILLAIAYIFGYCPYAATALQCWYSDDPMYVEATLETDAGTVVVRRGVKGLAIGKVKGKAAEELLTKTCGVDSYLRQALTYRDQVKPMRFLDMRDGKMKEFLIEVLGLQGLEKEIDIALNRLNQKTVELDRAKKALVDRQTLLEALQAQAVPFTPEDTTGLESELAQAQSELAQIKMTHLAARSRVTKAEADEEAAATATERAVMAKGAALADKVHECDGHIATFTEAMQKARAAYDAETEAMRKEARSLHNELARSSGLMLDIERIQREIEHLQKSVCPTCDRTWANAEAALADHEAVLVQAEAKLAATKAHQPRVHELDEAIASRRFQPDSRLEKLKLVRVNLAQQLAVISAEAHTARRAFLGGDRASSQLRKQESLAMEDLISAQTKTTALEAQLGFARQSNRQGQAAWDAHQLKTKGMARGLVELALAVTAAESGYGVEEDYVSLLKGFRNKIFDEVLAAIGAEATNIIATLPNAQHIAIEFRSEHVTQKDTVQEKISAVTTVHGHERVLAESVSGGQLTSINLAVDLAVARVISARLGCNLNWIILDESFNGHDNITKGSCLEMLQKYAADKLVIVVDHTSEFKEMFTQTIVVNYHEKESSLA